MLVGRSSIAPRRSLAQCHEKGDRGCRPRRDPANERNPMTEIRHIVFDLGNVLLRWNPELPYLRLIPDPIVRKRFLADICNGDWLIQTDRGMDWPEAETVLIARHPEEAEMIRAFRKHWHEMAPGLVEGSAEILTELLDRGYDVTALTNFAADTFLEAKPRF